MKNMKIRLLAFLAVTGVLSACSDSSGSGSSGTGSGAAPEYALTDKPYTALQQVWVPLEPSPAVRATMNDGNFTVYEHQRYAENGLGMKREAGHPWIEHRELAPGFSQEGTQRRSLAYILAIADPQIIDEESPIRMDGYASVYRPHGQLTPHLFEAHVRTARRISDLSTRPFDFTVLAGDLTDTSQVNEINWMITTLNGGIIDPDSGVDDDPVPGPGNDFNDPFASIGTDWPWYAALGNHDVLHVGGFGLITPELREAAVGDKLFTDSTLSSYWAGYVAGDQPDHPVVTDENAITPPDDDRLPLYQQEMLQILYDAGGKPAGHGLSQDDVDSSKAYYSVQPVPGAPIRMIVLDSTDDKNDSLGTAQLGSMDTVQFSWLHEELVRAASNQELVIVVAHHRLEDFRSKSEVPAEMISSLLESSDNVILMITGHGHADRKRLYSAQQGAGYWELMTASTIDVPLQSRIVELVDEGNGYLSIYVTNFDHNSQEQTPADKARQLAGGKLAFGTTGFDGDTVAFWAEDVPAQNLLLRVKLPQDIVDKLAQMDGFSQQVESVDTLFRF